MSIVPGRDVPEVPQEWVDAVNQAINDANHEDLCSSLHTLAECGTYKPGQWDIGVDLTIAVAALEPLIRERVAVELADAQSRIAAARGEIWRQDTAAHGTPAQKAVSDALAAVETHLVGLEYRPSRAWLFWSDSGVLLDVAEYPEPVTLWHAQVRYAADRDMPAASIEPIPDEKLPAVRALYDHASGGLRITRDDVKEILP